MRARYRNGSLTTVKRKKGDVWVYRYVEGGVRRAITMGSAKHMTERQARMESERYRLRANLEVLEPSDLHFGALLDRYEQYEMPERKDTRRAYLTSLNCYIRPRWGETRLEEMVSRGSAFLMEQWLRSLKLAPKTKGNIKGVMSTVFKAAERWGLINVGSNPMKLVRVKGVSKRQRAAPTLTPDHIRTLLAGLQDPYRLMVALDACSGLRSGELFGLMWKDVDWDSLTLRVERSWVDGVLQGVKTQYSERPMPLDPDLAEMLLEWKRRSAYSGPDDFIFASVSADGEKPLHSRAALVNYIRPAAVAAGLPREVSWHSFRRTFSTLLRANGEDIKVQQTLLRHADVRM